MGALFSLNSGGTSPWTGNVISVSITTPGSGYIASSNLPTINIKHREYIIKNGTILSNELTNLYVDITVGGQGEVTGVNIVNGGLFYNVGDVVTILSDTYSEPAELTVTGVMP